MYGISGNKLRLCVIAYWTNNASKWKNGEETKMNYSVLVKNCTDAQIKPLKEKPMVHSKADDTLSKLFHQAVLSCLTDETKITGML